MDATTMDAKQRNAVALRKRVDGLTGDYVRCYQSVLRHASPDKTRDYSSSAQNEVLIKENAMAIVSAAQKTALLIRELQELWLFGSLDTLKDPVDEEVDKAKALEIAGLIERLAKEEPVAMATTAEEKDV